MSDCSSIERGRMVPRVDDPNRKCCAITPLSKCNAIRDCSVVIEVAIDDCSLEESTALLAVSVRKLNTDILSFLLVHFVGGFAFFDSFSRSDKRSTRNTGALQVQLIARCRKC